MEYAYAITCNKNGSVETKISGNVFHDFNNALSWLKRRGDNPKPDEFNPMIWTSKENTYKVIPLTYED